MGRGFRREKGASVFITPRRLLRIFPGGKREACHPVRSCNVSPHLLSGAPALVKSLEKPRDLISHEYPPSLAGASLNASAHVSELLNDRARCSLQHNGCAKLERAIRLAPSSYRDVSSCRAGLFERCREIRSRRPIKEMKRVCLLPGKIWKP